MNDIWHFDPDIPQPDDPIVGYQVVASDGAMGTLAEASHDPHTSFVVVETGGLRHKQLVVPAGCVRQINAQTRKVFLGVDKATVKNGPAHQDDWRSDPDFRDRVDAHYTGLPV
jgi:hypothetical protein